MSQQSGADVRQTLQVKILFITSKAAHPPAALFVVADSPIYEM